MTPDTLPTWSAIATGASHRRELVGEYLRRWAAGLHAASRRPGLPSRWVAAFDTATRPYRSRLVTFDESTTTRDQAEAASEDLWDAVAAAWAFVRWANREKLEHAPGLEHVAAELHAAGRWLAEYPVLVAGHERAISELFAGVEKVVA